MLYGPKCFKKETRNCDFGCLILKEITMCKITKISLCKVSGGSADMAGGTGQDNSWMSSRLVHTHLQLRRSRAIGTGSGEQAISS